MYIHTLCVSPPTVNSKQFEDEVTALLESTHNHRLSVIELTKAYNEVFRNQAHKKEVKLPPISVVEMVETLRTIPRFNVRNWNVAHVYMCVTVYTSCVCCVCH